MWSSSWARQRFSSRHPPNLWIWKFLARPALPRIISPHSPSTQLSWLKILQLFSLSLHSSWTWQAIGSSMDTLTELKRSMSSMVTWSFWATSLLSITTLRSATTVSATELILLCSMMRTLKFSEREMPFLSTTSAEELSKKILISQQGSYRTLLSSSFLTARTSPRYSLRTQRTMRALRLTQSMREFPF